MDKASQNPILPIKTMPKKHTSLELDGVFTIEDYQQLMKGFTSTDSNEKWLIYFQNDWLYFHRASTGACIFALNIILDKKETHYIAPIALVNRDPAQYVLTDSEYDVHLIGYLIDRYLFKRSPTFPFPKNLHQKHRDAFQKSLVGRSQEHSNAFIRLDVIT